MERVVGGVELSLKFAHSEDLHRVMSAARSVGWQCDVSTDVTTCSDDDDDDDVMEQHYSVSVAVDAACMPLEKAMLAGETHVDPATRCYVRYKLYDKGTRLYTIILYMYLPFRIDNISLLVNVV